MKAIPLGQEKTAVAIIKHGEPNSKITMYTDLGDNAIDEIRTELKKPVYYNPSEEEYIIAELDRCISRRSTTGLHGNYRV